MPKPLTTAVLKLVSITNKTVVVSTAGTRAAPGSSIVDWNIDWSDGTVNQQISHDYNQYGEYKITLGIIDSKGRTSTAMIIIRLTTPPVEPPPPPDFIITNSSPLSNAVVGTFFSLQFNTSGGTNPIIFQIISGTIPTGMTFSTSGLYSGTPNSSGNASFRIRATDALSVIAEKDFFQTIQPGALQIITASLPPAQIGIFYSLTLQGIGGVAPYSWALVSGAFPPGISLVGDTIQGTPTSTGNFTIQIRLQDSILTQVFRTYTLSVNIVSSPMEDGVHPRFLVVGNAYQGLFGPTIQDVQNAILIEPMRTHWQNFVNRVNALFTSVDPDVHGGLLQACSFISLIGLGAATSTRTVTDIRNRAIELYQNFITGSEGNGQPLGSFPSYDWLYPHLNTIDKNRAVTQMKLWAADPTNPLDDGSGAQNGARVRAGLTFYKDGIDDAAAISMINTYTNIYSPDKLVDLHDFLLPDGGWIQGSDYQVHEGGTGAIWTINLHEAWRTSHGIPKSTYYSNPSVATMFHQQYNYILYLMRAWKATGSATYFFRTSMTEPPSSPTLGVGRWLNLASRIVQDENITAGRASQWIAENITGVNSTYTHPKAADLTFAPMVQFCLTKYPVAASPTTLGLARSKIFRNIGYYCSKTSWENINATSAFLASRKYINLNGSYYSQDNGGIQIDRGGPLICWSAQNTHHGFSILFGASTFYFPDLTYGKRTIDNNPGTTITSIQFSTPSVGFATLHFSGAHGISIPADPKRHAAVRIKYGASNFSGVTVRKVTSIVDFDTVVVDNNVDNDEFGPVIPGTAILPAIWDRLEDPNWFQGQDEGSQKGQVPAGELTRISQLAIRDIGGIERSELIDVEGRTYDYIFTRLTKAYNSTEGLDSYGNIAKISNFTREFVNFYRDTLEGTDKFITFERVTRVSTNIGMWSQFAGPGDVSGVIVSVNGVETSLGNGEWDYTGDTITIENGATGSNGKAILKALLPSSKTLTKIGGFDATKSGVSSTGLDWYGYNCEGPYRKQGPENDTTPNRQYNVGYRIYIKSNSIGLSDVFLNIIETGTLGAGPGQLTTLSSHALLSSVGCKAVRFGTRLAVFGDNNALQTSYSFTIDNPGSYQLILTNLTGTRNVSGVGATITKVNGGSPSPFIVSIANTLHLNITTTNPNTVINVS